MGSLRSRDADSDDGKPSQRPGPSQQLSEAKLSIPLGKAEEVITDMLGAFRTGFTAFEKSLPSSSKAEKMELPVWEGAVSWMEVQERLVRNNGGEPLVEEECMLMLRKITHKDPTRVTSHDFRVMLLLMKDINVAACVKQVTNKFSASKPKLVMSYRWKGPLSNILRALSNQEELDKDVLIWVDVLFNPQSFDALDGDAVVGITRFTYADEDAENHFLFISEDETMEEIMDRGWIVLEVASRMASKLPMARFLDPHNKASEWYLSNKQLTGSNPKDFFNSMKTWDLTDKARIQKEIVRLFGSAEQFNRTATVTFIAAGGKQLIETMHAEKNYADLLPESDSLCEMLEREGKYQDSCDVCKLLLHAAQQLYGHQHILATRFNLQLAESLVLLGQLDLAMEHAVTSFNVLQLLCTGDHAEVTAAGRHYNDAMATLGRCQPGRQLAIASSLAIIGGIHTRKGEYSKALGSLDEALRIREAVLGHESRDVALTLSGMAELYRGLEDSKKALEYGERALAINTKILGHEHMEVAESLLTIGNVYQTQGKYDLALSKHKQAMAIQVKNVGHENTFVAASLNNIGMAYSSLGDNKTALKNFERALTIDIKVLGHNHVDVATSEYNIAVMKRSEGKKQEASALFRHCAEVFGKSFGPDHSETVDALKQAMTTGAGGLAVGDTVELFGLVASPQLNGQTGVVVTPLDTTTGRQGILLIGHANPKAIRSDNLAVLSGPAAAAVRAATGSDDEDDGDDVDDTVA